MRNKVDNAWAQVDVQLQRRYDLIPNLVETVKGYAAHESKTLDAVTQARAAVTNAKTRTERVAAENVLSSTLKSLFAVAEQYPDLKANAGFVELQRQLEDTEDKISYMRQSFNDVVMEYNNAIQQFPGTVFSGLFGFERRSSYDADLGTDTVPDVDF
ncbi:MAG: LemA family protein [Eggerthellaceae bacterium]|nr:LemA family protein [Eggerthellaceae bacterium]